MADNYLITGYHGVPHVTAENDRGINAGICGTGRFVLPIGKKFKAEYIGNNIVRMYDGKLMDNGTAAGIPAGEYIDFLIPTAGQGMTRSDLIVFQYEKNTSTLVESGSFVVVYGEETSTSTANDPALTQANLLEDDVRLEQMALYRVSVSDTTVSTPEQLFEVGQSLQSLDTLENYDICGKNLIFNMPPILKMQWVVPTSATTSMKVPMYGQEGNVGWSLKQSAKNTDWFMISDTIVEDSPLFPEDANFPGKCRWYVGYRKPAGVGEQCIAFYYQLKALNRSLFKAGQYTLSYWIHMSGGSNTHCPALRTSLPSSPIGKALNGSKLNQWVYLKKTFTISEDTDTLYVILDSISPDKNTERFLRFADVKLEYGSVATRFDPDYTTELMLSQLANIQTAEASVVIGE